MRSRERSRGLVKIVPELRETVTFKRINLMEQDLGIKDRMDIIFFRNVLIYFDKHNQETILNRLCTYLRPQGYLFVGHSETLNGLSVPALKHEKTTIYKKREGVF